MILWKRLFHNICIDKMKALFPIKKEYVKKIFDGSKAYEYRKSFCSLEVDTIVIYESRGKGLVVGEFEIADRLCDTPRNIWERTKGYAGISESDFFSYFEGRDKACAYVCRECQCVLEAQNSPRLWNQCRASEFLLYQINLI